jgi:hypothetical protein
MHDDLIRKLREAHAGMHWADVAKLLADASNAIEALENASGHILQALARRLG